MNRHFLAVIIAAATLAPGCAQQGDFPSLAVRPAELEDWTEEPVRVAPEVAPDSALRLRVQELRTQAARGERAFEADYGSTEAAIGRAGAEGSDSWIDAQQALSRLQASQAEVMEALDQLEQLALGRAEMPTNADDLAAIDGIKAVVAETAAAQTARIARLAARLSR